MIVGMQTGLLIVVGMQAMIFSPLFPISERMGFRWNESGTDEIAEVRPLQ